MTFLIVNNFCLLKNQHVESHIKTVLNKGTSEYRHRLSRVK